MRKSQIVIIDDHELLRRGFIGALGNAWTVAGQAADIAEAKKIFGNLAKPPDLVVLDIALRGGDWGLNLIPWLEEVYGMAAPPVLVYTVYADYAHVRAAVSVGARGYVSKDEGFPVLEEAMRMLMRGRTHINPNLLFKLAAVPDMISGLTKREKEIFLLVQQGRDNKHIAQQLALVPRTVECYLNRIY
ncbi:MAG: response regulator transcription factor, partial [Spirochaetia bacterium]|nr:response regulator transcription factor [Spirochaetia bacterium]